jgi:hypothetical protein
MLNVVILNVVEPQKSSNVVPRPEERRLSVEAILIMALLALEVLIMSLLIASQEGRNRLMKQQIVHGNNGSSSGVVDNPVM